MCLFRYFYCVMCTAFPSCFVQVHVYTCVNDCTFVWECTLNLLVLLIFFFLSLDLSNLPSGSYEPAIDIDQQTDSNHDTGLILAAAGGHDDLVELLLERGADIEHRDKKGKRRAYTHLYRLLYNHPCYRTYMYMHLVLFILGLQGIANNLPVSQSRDQIVHFYTMIAMAS